MRCIKMSPEVLQIEDNEILYDPINQPHTSKKQNSDAGLKTI